MQLSRQIRDTLCGRTWPRAGRHGGRLLGLVRVVPLLHARTHGGRTCTMGSTYVWLCLSLSNPLTSQNSWTRMNQQRQNAAVAVTVCRGCRLYARRTCGGWGLAIPLLLHGHASRGRCRACRGVVVAARWRHVARHASVGVSIAAPIATAIGLLLRPRLHGRACSTSIVGCRASVVPLLLRISPYWAS